MQNLGKQRIQLKQQGFNLLELLVVLGLIAITLGILVPTGQSMLEKSRLISAANDAYSALLYTRNEATRLRTKARLCFIASTNASNCSAQATEMLGVFVKKTAGYELEKHYELREQVSLVFKSEENKRIEFEEIGNRQAVSSGEDVYLEITAGNLKRQVEVCFNGRIFIRDQLDTSECR